MIAFKKPLLIKKSSLCLILKPASLTLATILPHVLLVTCRILCSPLIRFPTSPHALNSLQLLSAGD